MKSGKLIVAEFWSAKQRQGNRLHEISYRACFKPKLVEYFIAKYSKVGDIVYDPFAGRGTTALQAALMGRIPIANDINPLSKVLIKPRLNPPTIAQVEARLTEIYHKHSLRKPLKNDLCMFYHNDTYKELITLKKYLSSSGNKADHIDGWIRMVTTNRLSGHSSGFFSVYTLPPNQATSIKRQLKLNHARKQKPEYRNVKELILKKTRSLLSDIDDYRDILEKAAKRARIMNCLAHETTEIGNDQVSLIVTSPPFMDIVNYAQDNWLRCWFNEIELDSIKHKITMSKSLAAWEAVMAQTLRELKRVLKRSGKIAFEVGELNKGKIKLDESIVSLAKEVGFIHHVTFINQQKFTKTSNIWGVKNNAAGTNTNRVVILEKCRDQ